MAKIGDHDVGLFLVDPEPFTFHPSLPPLEHGDTLLLGVCDEHQEKLPWYTIVERTRKLFQHQDEEHSAKGKALMPTDSDANSITVLTTDLHTVPWNTVHAPGDTYFPFLDTEAPQGPP